MKKIYLNLTQFFDTTLLGIFFGLISGVAINLLTGEAFFKQFWLTMIMALLSLIALVGLTLIRRKIDEAYGLRSDLPINSKVKWAAAAGYDKKDRLVVFCICWLVLLISFGSFLVRVSAERKKAYESDQANTKNVVFPSHDTVYIELPDRKAEIVSLKDSIRKLDAMLQREKSKKGH